MVSIAIVEDGDKEAAALTRCLERYEKENCTRFSYVRFSDAMSFLEYREAVDIVFMDIMLPNISGIEAVSRRPLRRAGAQDLQRRFGLRCRPVGSL